MLDGGYIEPAGNLLSDSDGEVLACGFEQSAALNLILQRFALRFSALEDGVGMAESIGQRFVERL